MLFALGAVASIWDGLQALTASGSSSSLTSTQQSQATVNPFDPGCGTQCAAATGRCGGTGGCSQISPETLGALIHAQSQSGAPNTAPINPQDALQDLFSKIDANGDGSITRSEFEDALGAGGTNLAAADDVFGKLDTNSDGSVSLDELKNALQGGHHHLHAAQSDPSRNSSTDINSDPLTQVLAGACRNAVTNSDGSTTTTITYANGTKVVLTTPPASSGNPAAGSATSSYNLTERIIQREAKALSASLAASLSVSA